MHRRLYATSTLLSLGTHGGLVAGPGITAGRIKTLKPMDGSGLTGVFAAVTALPALEAGICYTKEISLAFRWSIFTNAIRFRSDSPIQQTGATGGTNKVESLMPRAFPATSARHNDPARHMNRAWDSGSANRIEVIMRRETTTREGGGVKAVAASSYRRASLNREVRHVD